MKIKAAKEIGIAAEHVQLPRTITEIELLDKVSTFYKKSSNKYKLLIQVETFECSETLFTIPNSYYDILV